jgi:hypothetical protein
MYTLQGGGRAWQKNNTQPTQPAAATPLFCVMQDNSSRFVSNMQQLQDSVAKYVAAIDQQVTWTGS